MEQGNEVVPGAIKLPLAIVSLSMALAAIFGAGASFLNLAMPAATDGNYMVVAGAMLGLIAATVGTPVMAKYMNNWLVRQVARVWQNVE